MSEPAPPLPDPAADQPAAAVAGGRPRSLDLAVRLMQAGGVLALLNIIPLLVFRDRLREHYEGQDNTAAEVDALVNSTLAIGLVVGLLSAALWFWMATVNGRGRKWARVLATAFFAMSFFSFISTISADLPIVNRILSVVVFGIGLGAIVALYRPESTAYYEQQSAPRSG